MNRAHVLAQFQLSRFCRRDYRTFIVAGVIILLSTLFFLYPAGIVLRVVFDSELKTRGQSRLLPGWYKSAAGRYSSWAETYLADQTATQVNPYDVAETEWPLFGSTFFLVTARDLKAQGKFDPSSPNIRRALEIAATIVASPDTATWVIAKYGDSYLERENVFYRMLVILGLSSYEETTGDTRYQPLVTQLRKSLSTELLKAPHVMADDYPGECYPNDVLWSVAAMQRAARLQGENHNELAGKLMAKLDGDLKSAKGIPAYQINSKSGMVFQQDRGCGTSAILNFAAELDPVIASHWYEDYVRHFWKETFWLSGFTETPRGSGIRTSDVDSGVIVDEFGSIASAFGIGAAKSLGHFDQAAPLTMEAVACSWPTPFGFLIPAALGKLAVNSGSLGEVAILFSMSRPTQTPQTIPYTGHAPGIVWALFFFYAGCGTLLIVPEVRACRKILRRSRTISKHNQQA